MKKKFGGMMDAQSGTFEGMMSNLQDWMGQTKRELMKPLFEVLKDKLKGLLEFLGSERVKSAITEWSGKLADGIGKALEVGGKLIEFGKKLVEYFGPENKFDLMRSLFGGEYGPKIDEVVRKIKDVIGVIGDMGAKLVSGDFKGAWDTLTGSADRFKGLLQTAADLAGTIARNLIPPDVQKAWDKMTEDLKPTLDRLGALFDAVATAISSLATDGNAASAGQTLKDAATLAGDAWSVVKDGINLASKELEKIIKFAAENQQPLKDLATSIIAVAVAVKGLEAATVALNAVIGLTPWGRVALLIAGVGAALYLAYENSEGFRQAVSDLNEALNNMGVPNWPFFRFLGELNQMLSNIISNIRYLQSLQGTGGAIPDTRGVGTTTYPEPEPGVNPLVDYATSAEFTPTSVTASATGAFSPEIPSAASASGGGSVLSDILAVTVDIRDILRSNLGKIGSQVSSAVSKTADAVSKAADVAKFTPEIERDMKLALEAGASRAKAESITPDMARDMQTILSAGAAKAKGEGAQQQLQPIHINLPIVGANEIIEVLMSPENVPKFMKLFTQWQKLRGLGVI